MDAFLTSLFAMGLAEFGDRVQLFCAILAIRYNRVIPIILALALASLINCIISAYLGSLMKAWISEDPIQLLYGFALCFAGIGMLIKRKSIGLLDNLDFGPFLTSFVGLFLLQLGDKGQFILATTTAYMPIWPLAVAGGWLGIMIACAPAAILQDTMAKILPLRLIRYVGGIGLLASGFYIALGAWGVL